jgi:copper chaperone NosL
MKKLHPGSRVLLAVGAIAVIACYFLPLWTIRLWAPQYPEGLSMQIWHNTLSGDVAVINGLNHYIGMKHINVEMFPEFNFLKYVIAGFIVFTLFTAWKGNLRWLSIYCGVILIGGLIALGDFYRWGYDYGHNLDPSAPIKVEGMAYQPPVLGYKVLLNFTALSVPAAGGWVVVALGVLAYAILIIEWKFRKDAVVVKAAAVLLLISVISGCSKEKPAIRFGQDNCDYCRMTIMDQNFGAVIRTDKGRVYRFDDFGCRNKFVKETNTDAEESYVVVYDAPGTVVEAEGAAYKHNEEIRSPMGSGIAAFTTSEACMAVADKLPGDCLAYHDVNAR